MSKKDYYEKNKNVLLSRSKECYINNKELKRERARSKYKLLSEDEKKNERLSKSNIEKI